MNRSRILRAARSATAWLLTVATTCLVLSVPAAASLLPAGTLLYSDCVARTADHGCQENLAAPIDPGRMAMSPDGKSIYATSLDGSNSFHGSLLRFDRNNTGGKITYAGCLADDASQGCGAVAGQSLDFPFDATVSQDGKSVYVISVQSDSITHFLRDTTTGALTYVGCLAKAGHNDNCQDLPGAHFDAPFQITASPDGKSVYVTTLITSSMSHFFRDTTTGALSYDRCFGSNGNTNGCVPLPPSVGISSSEVVVSPDNKSVYVSGFDSVLHFSRNGSNGQISYAGCMSNSGSSLPCTKLPSAPFRDTIRMAVAPDNRSLYAVSSVGTITHFFRAEQTGELKYERCLGNSTLQGCQPIQNPVLDVAFDVAVNPDNLSVYVVSQSGSIAHFTRNATGSTNPLGRITYKKCHANTASLGCQPLPGEPFGTPISMVTSPDGRSVYVVSSTTKTITNFNTVAAGP